MRNKYVRDIIQMILNTECNKIMVCKSKLSDEEINLISGVAAEFNKTIIFASISNILFNNDANILVKI